MKSQKGVALRLRVMKSGKAAALRLRVIKGGGGSRGGCIPVPLSFHTAISMLQIPIEVSAGDGAVRNFYWYGNIDIAVWKDLGGYWQALNRYRNIPNSET
jgi:hypothetical protein